MRLLERDPPLELLHARARRTTDGRGSVVVLTGEAGIGKTVLLRAFAERAPVPVLWGMCDSLSTPRPLGPLRDVADDLGVAVSTVLREASAQHEIFAAVLGALRERPRVLVVEDLHWGDQGTLDLVRFLGRRIGGLPLLLVVTCRESVGPDDPLRPVLGDLVSAPDADRVQLAPLSRTAVAELVGGHGLDPADVHARTAGNPFFVSQIAAQPHSPLPASVRDAVVARTARLAPPERRALELLSCAPDGVSGELLAALFMPQATVEALGATGLLDRHGHGVAFRHEIARSAVLDAVAPGAETALHAAMIAALEAVGGDASVLAHHAVAAADVPRILRYAPAAAADAARSGAHREAVAGYRLALEHTGDDPAARADLLEHLGEELYYTDRLADAIAARTAALALRRELGDVVAVAAAHRALARFEHYAANRAAAEGHAEAAIAVLSGQGRCLALGYALANRADLAVSYGDPATARQTAGEAARIADELGDIVLSASAAARAALVRLYEGDQQARSELLAARDIGLQLARDHGLQGVDELVTELMSMIANHDVEQGMFAEADDILADALRISDEHGVLICQMWQRGLRARLRLFQGRWADAEQDALTVLAAGHVPLGRLWSHLALGLLTARRTADADNPHLDEVWRLAALTGFTGKLASAVAALAEQAWITRRPDPRLTEAVVGPLAALPSISGDELSRWVRRLAAAGVQHVLADLPPAPQPLPAQLPYERAMALWDSGSVDDLLAALPLLDDLDARAVAVLFRGRLRELGVANPPRGPSPATRANPAGLTDRQLDVLALLVDGLSNADIAARLVISRKTADHHVSAILGKLGVRSRGEAAAAARRTGLVPALSPPTAPAAPAAR